MSGQDNDFREIIDDENTDTSSDVVEVTGDTTVDPVQTVDAAGDDGQDDAERNVSLLDVSARERVAVKYRRRCHAAVGRTALEIRLCLRRNRTVVRGTVGRTAVRTERCAVGIVAAAVRTNHK